MSAFFITQTTLVPHFYYDNKFKFFKACLKDSGLLCNVFNSSLEIAYQGGFLENRIRFNKSDFNISNINFSKTKKAILIDLPLPLNASKNNLLKSYYIPYLQYENEIKILDLFAVQNNKDKPHEYLLIKFIKYSDYKICCRIKDNDDCFFINI